MLDSIRGTKLTKLGLLLLVSLAVVLGGCNRGDSDGGDAVEDDAGIGVQFVGDGGAGATLAITAPSRLGVGATSGFSVMATDSAGAPLGFIRIFCESERGIAILEPSSGGTAFEMTNSRGFMSGVVGGLTPGSYILECRGPLESQLVARAEIVITGSVPEGFVGFPGAAGGNLGGGLLIDETPDPDTGGLRIAAVNFTDAGGTGPFGPIDTVQGTCDPGDDDTFGTADDELEPFTFTNYEITLNNDSFERLFVGTVAFTINDGRPATIPTQSKTVELPPRSSGSLSGLLISFASGSQIWAGSSFGVLEGTYRVDITLTGTSETGDAFTLTDSTSITLRPVNNCP